jgi:hypothetical protein
VSASSDLISKEFDSLFAASSASDDSRASADVIGGVVAAAGGSGNVQNAPSNSGAGGSPQSQPSAGSSILSDAEGFAEGLLGPIPSIISDIAGIFGGGGAKAAPVFPKYELPASIDFQGTVNASGALDAGDTNQYGDPRDLVSASTAAAPAPVASPTAAPAGGGSSSGGHTFHQTFNMQAFDGDGMAAMSDQIAASVRQSLLTSNALSDVITNDLN